MDIVYRRANSKDIVDIFYVESRCFKSPWSMESIREDISENERALYVVAAEGGRIIGFCAMHSVFDEGHIMNVAVLEEYRGKRIGEKLLKKMFELAPPEVENYTLEVRVSNAPAIKLYTRMGFRSFGLRPGYYADTGESAMIMWLNTGQKGNHARQ
jgi:ribosomal-protein-alanine N-acetyltransferase